VGVGMGDGTPSPPATALPMTIGLAAGFDPALAREYGDLIGSETATLGQHVLEGPGVCLHRTPISGRNFEYFSEDPYLSGVMGVEVARAIQEHGVIAMAKHYVCNDQEYERFRANVEVDEATLRELYLLPFEMLVKDADVAAIMSAYNRVRGTYATEHRYLLHAVLREEWGFQGYVQSDFWSCRSAAPAINAGLDHEMPDAKWLGADNVMSALHDTSLEIETVDRALVRRYTQMFRFGQFERPPWHLLIGHGRQQMGNHVEASATFVLGLDHPPGCDRRVGMHEHLVLGPRIVRPPGDRLKIHRRQLPLSHRVGEPGAESALLLLIAHREPVLAQHDSVVDEQLLEHRALREKSAVLFGGTEPHHPFDPGPVVPGPVHEDDFPGSRQVRDVALEIPLSSLALGRSGQSDDPRNPGIQELRDAFDRAPLPRGVASFEDDQHAGS